MGTQEIVAGLQSTANQAYKTRKIDRRFSEVRSVHYDGVKITSPRATVGGSFEALPMNTTTNVGITKITVGKRYRVVFKSAVRPRKWSDDFILLAAKNSQKELMLCMEKDDGTPFGGWRLDSFLEAMPVTTN